MSASGSAAILCPIENLPHLRMRPRPALAVATLPGVELSGVGIAACVTGDPDLASDRHDGVARALPGGLVRFVAPLRQTRLRRCPARIAARTRYGGPDNRPPLGNRRAASWPIGVFPRDRRLGERLGRAWLDLSR